jgi:hypothetical protein
MILEELFGNNKNQNNMKLSPTAGLLLYSTVAMLIISVLVIIDISLWGIIGLSYLLPFTITGIVASLKKMGLNRQQKCQPNIPVAEEIHLSSSPAFLLRNRSRKCPPSTHKSTPCLSMHELSRP